MKSNYIYKQYSHICHRIRCSQEAYCVTIFLKSSLPDNKAKMIIIEIQNSSIKTSIKTWSIFSIFYISYVLYILQNVL